jgi:NADH:ubiquinone oxidoreductase subunit E
MERLNLDSLRTIDEIVKRHRDEPGPVIVMLHDVQDSLGYVPFEAMEKIEDETGTSVADVYGVVCFYAQFTTSPKGKHVINVCLGTACYVKGAGAVLEEIEKVLGIEDGGCTPDGKFSLEVCRCVGACGLAPVMIVDGDVYGKMTPDRVAGILAKYE